MQGDGDKIRYLDGLRGVAALAVVLSHVLIGFYPAFYTGDPRQAHHAWEVWAAGSPFNMVSIGNCFVCIFFMLSGYVLTYSVLSKQRQSQFLALAAGRYVRLTLPILASSFLAYLILKSGGTAHVEVAPATNSYWWLPTLYQFTPDFADMSIESVYRVYQFDTNYNPALWTMRIELLGSFMVFGILALCRSVRLRMAAYLLVSLFFFSPYYFCFIAGMFFYDVRSITQRVSPAGKQSSRIISSAITGMLFILGAFLGAYPYAYTVGTWYQGLADLLVPQLGGDALVAVHLLAAALLMLAVERSVLIRRLLCGRLLQFVGRNAFSIYLLHLILIVSVFSASFQWAFAKVSYDAAFWLAALVFIAVLLLLSNGMYSLIDRPSVQLGHRIGRAIERAQQRLLEAVSARWVDRVRRRS
ncbi:acyltransferase [soil metagenome]